MGSGFICRCGHVLRDFSDAHHRLVPWAALFTTDGGDPLYVSQDLFRCPNCGRITIDGPDGFEVFVRNDAFPRVWADMSDRDELGRVWLRHPRSLAEIREQGLQKPFGVTLYDDAGREYRAEVFDGLNEEGEPDPRLSAARLED
ncbi:hypothetical protein ACPPVO_19300 [Dactylosporangium sp. McL0621]|uniref:hypothetical protein n=1 Tax=Dactylosporangium sp. McL0621 TaxID=3415678 RepID=UPI003CF33924